MSDSRYCRTLTSKPISVTSSPPPSPAILGPSKGVSEKQQINPDILNNHLNNLCTTMDTDDSTNRVVDDIEEDEDYSFFLSENGHLSFENPNYQLPMATIDPARLDDHLNSNVQAPNIFEELRFEMQKSKEDKKRKGYAAMDLGLMGVDVDKGPKTELDNKLADLKMKENLEDFIESSKLKKAAEIESDKLVESVTEKGEKSDGDEDTKEDKKEVKKRKNKKRYLPEGWEQHQDEQGPYYWHIKSGTIQREPPIEQATCKDKAEMVKNVRSSRIFDDDFDVGAELAISRRTMPKSCTSGSIAEMSSCVKRNVGVVIRDTERDSKKEWKRRSMPTPTEGVEERESQKAMQVSVYSLGWIELREDELTPENSSKAVNRCIIQLASQQQESQEVTPSTPGQWGEGKKLTLELNEGSLTLIQPETGTVLNSQPIHSIRVWGVGRDNGKDFAYVARDKATHKHMCHVFRCEVSARGIANALRDICKKILIERSLAQSSTKLTGRANAGVNHHVSSSRTRSAAGLTSNATKSKKDQMRPTSLGSKLKTKTVPPPESFPTPMEEPRKVMQAWFLGTMEVNKPCGIDVIHNAIDHMLDTVPRPQWQTVSVAVAPSTITISFHEKGLQELDCRVRFLSFLGIGKNTQQCAFIMHTAQDTFVVHVFHCEPSAGLLCKTIEAACKLRYQKCLDARPQQLQKSSGSGMESGAKTRIGSTLKNILGSWTTKVKPNSHMS